jgi:hypothetical protein
MARAGGKNHSPPMKTFVVDRRGRLVLCEQVRTKMARAGGKNHSPPMKTFVVDRRGRLVLCEHHDEPR